jgi:NAD(P)-dependent dehydrogenase (short-subunit alcohol dehydrogenase family)
LSHLEKTGAGLPSLKLCIVAGEPLRAELVVRSRAQLPRVQLLNNYGCTELMDITYYDTSSFDAGSPGFVPIGYPIQNTQIYVLDRRGRLVPEGVAGEIHVASDSMALGYHDMPSLTQERFKPNPFSDNPDRILYNTGDVAKYLPDGALEYIGRWDVQVKVRGFRVDVRHVEKVLSEFPGLVQPVVVGDGQQLFAFYVAQPGTAVDIDALRAYLQARLPSYMVPGKFVAMDALPRLPNGKLNRRALTPSAGRLAHSDVYEAPETKTEALLASIWSGVLDVPEDIIGRKTNFFEVGGHSLAAVRVVARIREHLSVEIPVSWLFERPRLQDLGANLDGASSSSAKDEDAWTASRKAGSQREGERRVPGLLEDKVVLMTGMHQGIIGSAARLLASQGAFVALGYLYDEPRATKLKELIEGGGGVAETYHADPVDAGDVTRMVSQVLERFGRIDVLVANTTAEFKVAPFVEQDGARFERTVVDELRAVFHVCQAVVPGMAQRKGGSIVVVSSAMSQRPEPGYVAHGVAKSALDGFVRSLAVELGSDGVRINTVAPGLTLTEATESLPLHVKDAAVARCPLRRNGLPRDVAGAVLFLASDLSQFMTGAYLPVDGGYTMP